MDQSSAAFTVVFTGNELIAYALKGRLETEGIPTVVTPAADSDLSTDSGYILSLLVPRNYEHLAKGIIARE